MMAKTRDPLKRSETLLPPIHRFYHDMMDLIETMPHVSPDLDALSSRGANREMVLRWLAIAAFATGFITVKKLKERETALRNLANDLNSLALRVDQLLNDRMSTADGWIRALGWVHEVNLEGLVRPTEAAEHIWECAKWAEENAESLSHLRAAERRTQG